METLLKRYTHALIIRGRSEKTIREYKRRMRYFFIEFQDRKIDELPKSEIEGYLLKLILGGVSNTSVSSFVSAIKFYYQIVAEKPNMEFDLPRPKQPKKLPLILSKNEVRMIIENATGGIKHRAILALAYSSGLRISEVQNLKIKDIDSKRMIINIENSKGQKDRNVPLSQNLLILLREYYKEYKPKEFLFEGAIAGGICSERSLQTVFRSARITAKIEKDVSFHSLRHAFATHHMESGTNLKIIQELLGHSDISTTARYLHVSTDLICSVSSPFDTL